MAFRTTTPRPAADLGAGAAAAAGWARAGGRLSPTLSVYIGRHVLLGIGLVLFAAAALAFVIDLVELLRDASDHDDVGFGLVVLLAGLHLPQLVQELMPFAVLFGAMLTFQRLTRSQELVAARAVGVSAWQFLLPALVIALGLGVLSVTVLNPLAAATAARFERLHSLNLSGSTSLVSVSSGGLWLRQPGAGDGGPNGGLAGDGELIIHARLVAEATTELQRVTVFAYDGTDGVRFAGRVDAPTARLEDGHWRLQDALITGPDGATERRADYLIPTDLTPERIIDSFAPPETVSFWDLPGFIATLEAVGMPTVAHRLQLQGLLAAPLLLCAMLLIGTTFSLRLVRRGRTGLLIGAGLATGFVFFILSDVVHAVGLAGQIPAPLAAWTPAGVAVLLGLATLFHLEDG